MPLGDQFAQLQHAAEESGLGHASAGDQRPTVIAVALAARDARHLADIAERLGYLGVPHRLISEPDPPYLGAPTAIGILPVADRRVLRKVTGGLPLLGGQR